MLQFFKRLFWGKTISHKSYKKFMGFLKTIESKDAASQIIESDKLYHAILKELGYSGSFGEILKRNPREIHNIQEIWNLHKLRNRLVHDLQKPKENLQKSAKNYIQIIEHFLKQISS